MKKRLVALVLALALVAPFAALADETYYQPGNVVPSIGIGASVGWGGFGLWLYPGVEFMVAKVKISGSVPLDFGVAVKGLLGVSGFGYGYFTVGAGAFGTAHLCFRGIDWDVDFLDPVDIWIGLGIAASLHIPYGGAGAWGGWPLYPAGAAGINYFLNDRFALMLSGGYWGEGGGYVGVLYKLGKGEKLIKKEG